MKRFTLLPAVVVILLAATMVGCTTMTGTQDEYYERSAPVGRVYVEDPYRGTVVLERDPYTGRYYEVGSYGNVYGRSSRVYNDAYYGRGGSNGRGYSRSNRGNYDRGNYDRGSVRPQQPSPQAPSGPFKTPEQKKERDDARKKILGN